MLRTSFILFLTLMVISLVSFTNGFCIYNKMENNNLDAVQMNAFGRDFSSRFSKIIPPGKSECCHYSNRDCNAGGDPEGVIRFTFYSEVDGGRANINRVFLKAGGYAIVTGDPFVYKVDTFDANDQPFVHGA